ncbi:MAG: hypothetical protein V4593_16430 [Pseudomonadota bacterium]
MVDKSTILADFEPSPYLMTHWNRVNNMAFEGSLPPLAGIGWLSHDGDPDFADIYGGFSARTGVISITHELRRAEDVEREIQRLNALPAPERPSFDSHSDEDLDLICAVLGLIAHEVAHQAAGLYEQDAQSHGLGFIRQAQRIASALGLPDVTIHNASTWPNVLPIILRERSRNSKGSTHGEP